MNIAIVGGSGTVGREAAAELKARGHAVQALSRANGVDLRRDLGDVLTGADVVVHAANGGRGLLVDGSRRLVQAAPGAHHVLISVVGCDRFPRGYFRAKAEQEDVVRAAPFSILRATQFHPYVAAQLRRAARFGVLPSASVPLQPVDAAEVGRALADTAEAEPSGAVTLLAGPEVLTLTAPGAWRGRVRFADWLGMGARLAPVAPGVA